MGPRAATWLERYRSNFADYETTAGYVERQIGEAFRGKALDIHVISVRAKDPDSVAEKIARRSYGNPSVQFDDLIGVRIITLYEHSVPLVASRLRDLYKIDENRSANKSMSLRSREVGYRSEHLVLKLGKSGMPPVSSLLEKTYIEVQIRSVVSHAWAEIEHSLRYKAGIQLPSDLSRRFDALAGTLELVDREFSAIEDALVKLVEQLVTKYQVDEELEQPLTPMALQAVMMAKRPAMVRLGPKNLPVPMEQAYQMTKAALAAGFETVAMVAEGLRQQAFLQVVRDYVRETQSQIEHDAASAVVVTGALIGTKAPTVFDDFRVFQLDPALVEAVKASREGI